MKDKLRKLTSLLLVFVMALGLSPTVSAAGTERREPDLRTEFTRSEQETQGVDPEEWVTVIVELKGDTTLDVKEFVDEFQQDTIGFSASSTVAAYRAGLVSGQEDIQAQISAMIPDAQFRYHYTNLLNGFAAKVQYKDIETIKSMSDVLDVYMTQSYDYSEGWEETEETLEYISLEEYAERYGDVGVNLEDGVYSVFSDHGSMEQMGLQAAWDAGYTGKGKVAAIFDSSLRHTHELFNYMDPSIAVEDEEGNVTIKLPAGHNFKTKESLLSTITANEATMNLFDSGWGNWYHQRPADQQGFSAAVQAQIKAGDFYHNLKVPFAVDYMDGDLEVWDNNTGSHGTHVAGITAGNPGPYDKTKPVSMDNVNGVLGSAYDSQIMFFKVFSESDPMGQEGDEAVFAALDDAVTLGVNSFNLSLGIKNGFTTSHTYAQAGYQKAYNRAAAAGISVAVSAGNDSRRALADGLLNQVDTIQPNSKGIGFSGSLFGPMTVASAQGTGYVTYANVTTTTMTAQNEDGTAIDGLDPVSLTDNNSTPLGTVLNKDGGYEIIACGDASEEDIKEAAGVEDITNALEGKIALISRSANLSEQFSQLVTAKAAGVIVANNEDTDSVISNWYLEDDLPTFGAFKSSLYDQLKGPGIKVKFTSETERTENRRSYQDNGPSNFTSWGVTEALQLKPDIMAPGGNIWSAGAASDTALSAKSGTSMASPNMAGAFLLIQQYVDANLSTFGVTKGNQEYTNVINWLAASNATVYQPLKNLSDDTQGRQNKYFSPRRQGAGMVNVEKVINSKVALHNSVPYNADTGEAPRTKVELGDKLGNSFTFSFVLENYNDEARIFDVLSCLQTDATTDNAGRSIIKNVSSNGRITSNDGSDIDPIKDAVITVDSVSSGATITSPSANINRYEELYSAPAKITVPAKSSTTVTVKVELNESTMAKYEKTFPSGMFLEGYVFFDSEEHENVNIPFLGFRGDWTQAPIFDTKTIYDELPASTTDPDYPFYYATAMASTVPGEGDSKDEIFLGVNQYTDTAWGGYYRSNPYNQLRSYFQTIRLAGGLKGDFSAISPNGDGYADIAYANLTPLRNVKALYVEIKDENGNVIRTMGPEFEYFKVRSDDGNLTQQVAATYGTKYLRDMDWDGKKDDGTVAPDGQYTYNVYGITEKEFLENPAYALGENTWDKEHHTMTGMTPEYKAKVLAALKASETKDSVSMPVKVDTAKPVLRAGITADGKWTVSVSDKESGVQALAFYYDGEMIGEPTLVNQADYSVTLDISEALSEIPDPDRSKLELQAVDYAFNIAKVRANEASDLTTEVIVGDPEISELPNDLKENPIAQKVQDALSGETKPAVDGEGKNSAETTILLEDKTTTESAKAELTKAGVTVAENAPITVVVETYLEIAVKKVPSAQGDQMITLDIAPKYRKIVTTDPSDIKTEGVGKNAAVVGEGDLAITKPVTVTVPLPAGFASNGSIYVQHNKGTKSYVYAGTVSDNILTFTNPNGFSEFVIGVGAPKAKIGQVGYATLQAAVNEVKEGETITLLASDSATVSKAISFTILHGEGVTPTLNPGSNIKIATEQVKGGTKYTCTTTSSGGGSGSGSGGGGGSATKPTTPSIPSKPSNPAQGGEQNTPTFTDITGHWAEKTIYAAVEAGLFKGTSDTTFSPNDKVNRAMFATILYRLHKEPAVTGASQFPDAVQGSWYYNAVIWAAENKVVLGMSDGTFAPNQQITREQMAAMLYRYAVYAGHANDTIQPLVGFKDHESVSSWAEEAMAWAVDNGYITGKLGDLLDPKGLATRAEAATILMRFLGK